MAFGTGDFRYEHVEGWVKIPEYFDLAEVVSVDTDSNGRVFVFNRGNHPVLIFEPDGAFVSCWGEGMFIQPHRVFIAPDDTVWLVDNQRHSVEQYTPDGQLLLELPKEYPWGKRGWGMPLILRSPFNQPTGFGLGPDGEMFVSDGYANFLIHKFSPTGDLLKTWGDPGTEPGQFACPHNLGVDRHGTVYVCDRENSRVQVFSNEGEFITMWEGGGRPSDVWMDWENDLVYLAEGRGSLGHPRISVRDLDGKIVSEFGDEHEGQKTGLGGAHGIGADSSGNIYSAERGTRTIQKFARVR